MHIALDKENLRDMLDKLNAAARDSLDITGAPEVQISISQNMVTLSIVGYNVVRVHADEIKLYGHIK